MTKMKASIASVAAMLLDTAESSKSTRLETDRGATSRAAGGGVGRICCFGRSKLGIELFRHASRLGSARLALLLARLCITPGFHMPSSEDDSVAFPDAPNGGLLARRLRGAAGTCIGPKYGVGGDTGAAPSGAGLGRGESCEATCSDSNAGGDARGDARGDTHCDTHCDARGDAGGDAAGIMGRFGSVHPPARSLLPCWDARLTITKKKSNLNICV